MHSDFRFHIVVAVVVLGDLQNTAVIAHRVIIARGVLLLNGQNHMLPKADISSISDIFGY